SAGFASLYPVCKRMAAKQASGMAFMIFGITSKANNNHKACSMADWRVRPPLLAFADDRTITDVIGKPPKKPLVMFHTPWAISSLFVGELRFKGSILSMASMLNKVSKLAIMASVSATVHTSGLRI